MKIVSSTGYGASGSTAVADLLDEYSNIQLCRYEGKPVELQFFYSDRSISSLYFYLVEGSAYTSTMHFAVNSFMNQCSEWANGYKGIFYESIFKNHFMEYTKEYIRELGGEDFFYSNIFSDLSFWEERKLQKLTLEYRNKNRSFKTHNYENSNLAKKETKYYMFDVTEELFLHSTKMYFDKLMRAFCDNEIAGFHTLIPITNIDEYARYFDNIRVITSDRDPRDIYLTERRLLRKANYPCYDVETFCKYQKWIRGRVKKAINTPVLNIQFEDLVYHYEETKKKIEQFAGLTQHNHSDMKTRFIPQRSAENCNLKRRFPDEAENIRIIEKELEEYLWDF